MNLASELGADRSVRHPARIVGGPLGGAVLAVGGAAPAFLLAAGLVVVALRDAHAATHSWPRGGGRALRSPRDPPRWRELLKQHHALVRRQLARFSGREVDTAGDGFFATFDGPARAIRCAMSIVSAVQEIGLELRAGLHTGECEVVDGKVGGIAVHIGARVAGCAAPGEVLVSGTVRDLVAGSGIQFEERGTVELKGVQGSWPLYAVAPAGSPANEGIESGTTTMARR